ncbi:hypothetical protein [Nocardia salmonicida]|uniref:hypothetical protein n=1 Tax=Nocardia salmonicida TaxID=53431 RepID=UPI0037A48C3A
MSYDLDIWEGEQPTSDAELRQKIIDIGDMHDGRYLRDEQPDPPTPKIAEFMQALLRRWPDVSEEGSPWKVGGAGDADGPTLHGLVCLDCQTGRLRP